MSAAIRDTSGLYLPARLIEERAREEVIAYLRARADVPVIFHGGGAGGAFGFLGLGSQPDPARLLAENVGHVATATKAIADRISSLSPVVSVRRRAAEGTIELEDLDDHPAAAVLEKPTGAFPRGLFSWRSLIRLTAYHLLLTGEAYWQKLRDGIGVVRELWPMPPQFVRPVPDPQLVIGGYEVRDGQGRVRALEARDVIRFWWPDPETLYTARGVLGPQAIEHDLLRFLAYHLREHFGNDATPRGVIIAGEKAKRDPNPAERDAFTADWIARYAKRGGSMKGAPAFLPTGYTFEELQAHGGTTELVPLMEHSEEAILSAFGVPGSIVGKVVDVNRAAAETNQAVFDQVTIKPITDLIAETLTDQFAAEYDPRLMVRYLDFVAADKQFELAREQADIAMKVRSPKQIRADRGWDPDEAPWGEFPPGSLADVPYTGEEPDFGAESADDLEAPRARGEAAARESGHPPTHTRAAAFTPEATWSRARTAERRFAGPFGRAMARVFETQRRDVVKRLRATEPRQLARATADDLFVPRLFEALYARIVEPIRVRVFTASGKQAGQLLGTGFSLTEAATDHLERLGETMRVRVDEVTKHRIARELAAGTAEGESVDQIAKRIDRIFGDRRRSRTIARTEVGEAHEQGQLESFRQSGVVEGKRWNTSLDAKVRDSHEATEGQVVPVDGTFTLGSGAKARAPLDSSLPASDRVSCRCFLTPVLAGEEG